MTNDERWSRLRELFAAAVGMSDAERRAFLEREIPDDPELRAELAGLLTAESGSAGFLAPPEGGATHGSIGPYHLLNVLGEGGFGVVYLAEQQRPLHRRVALKLIKPGMDTRQVIARFEAERQALAFMDHPGIAQVFDAGETERGHPYFVMEYVDGIPLTTFCDRHRMGLRPRLELFLEVCDAVQHAHQKGVIHRDLKPSNVLVAQRDGVAVPKVIDFGIAKATVPGSGEATLLTHEGMVVGTLGSMSPEQAGAIEATVDTRSDIYALGVLLYEILVGAPPFDSGRLRAATWADAIRVIREEDPPPLAARAEQGVDVEAVARLRGTESRSLLRELRGDLEWITRRALEKEPDRRYPSVSELAADLRRHLANEPVLAGAPSTTYRIRKFVRRHRAVVGATAAVLVALVAGIAASTWGMVRAMRAERAAAREAAVAEAVNSFLTDDLLAAVAPSARKGRGRDVLMREVLDAAADRIDEAAQPGERFAGEPLVEASIRRALGETYMALGENAAAEPHLRRALELQERVPESVALAARLGDLALLYFRMGRYEEAEPLFRRALEVRRRVAPADTVMMIATAFNLATQYQRQARFAEAESMYVDMLAVLRRVEGDESDRTLMAMNNLANLYQEVGRFAEAESLQTKVLDARFRAGGEEDPSTLFSMNNLANILSSQGHLGRAKELLERALELKRKVLGPEHPSTINSLASLASLHDSLGGHAAAEALHREALALREKVLGPDHPGTQDTRNSLAFSLAKQGRFREGMNLAKQSLATCREKLGEGHPTTIAAELMIAFCEEGQSRLPEAEASFRNVLARLDSAEGADPLLRGMAESHLALVLGRLGRRAEAGELMRNVLRGLPLWESESRDVIRSAVALLEEWDAADPSAGWGEQAAELRSTLASR